MIQIITLFNSYTYRGLFKNGRELIVSVNNTSFEKFLLPIIAIRML
jgi:hypothetical protein